MKLTITTSTGSVYVLDTDQRDYWKNGRYQYRYNRLRQGDTLLPPDEHDDSWVAVKVPEVGKHMYISGYDGWYVTTPITSVDIEE